MSNLVKDILIGIVFLTGLVNFISGEFIISPDYQYAMKVISNNKGKFPCAYTVDIAVLESNENVSFELNKSNSKVQVKNSIKEVLHLGEKLRKFQLSASEISKEVEEETLYLNPKRLAFIKQHKAK